MQMPLSSLKYQLYYLLIYFLLPQRCKQEVAYMQFFGKIQVKYLPDNKCNQMALIKT